MNRTPRVLRGLIGMFVAGALLARTPAAEPSPQLDIFRRDHLIAWCIVPFDAQKRGPEERAAMLNRLGFRHFAYDYRAEHIASFDDEVAACKRHGIALDAWWFPGSLNDQARLILDVCRRHNITPQLWVSGGGNVTQSPQEQQERIAQEIARIRPIAEAAMAQGMKVGLYNHGGWFGEPENQLAIIEQLKLPNVGIVYNWHHGHAHIDRWPGLLKQMMPHLLAVNLNGMNRQGDQRGQKILQLGQGELDLQLLRTLHTSGYRGPIGILGHTSDDAELRLRDNLDGLDWLVKQLDGSRPGPRPLPRTPVPTANSVRATAAVSKVASYLAPGRSEYRAPPLTVDLRATLSDKQGYNILVASDTKASAAHWELFTQPKTGALTAYLPGMTPDHVRSGTDLCDGKPHQVRMVFEPVQVSLYVDGKLAAQQSIQPKQLTLPPMTPTTSGFGLGRLVEGGLATAGTIEFVRLTRGGAQELPTPAPTTVDADTLGLWLFDPPAAVKVLDRSGFKNHASRSDAAQPTSQPQPPPGVHLTATNPQLQVTLVDRSPDEVYMGVKVDRDGCVFVGGREAVFIFEPQADGQYRRKELLRFPAESIIMGLEFRANDLYVVANNAVYLVPEGRVQRTGLQPQRILWGLPLDLHVSFHCLAWGPDGDLYLTHGDPLLSYGDWTRPDHWGHWTLYCGRHNEPLHYTGQGAVLRMKPDGTKVSVVATGLRGPVGLAFDGHGNLFTNDNDHESKADQYAPARLLHVVPGIDFGWPRGWMASKSPDRFDLVEPVCPDLGRGVPCDLAWYDHRLFGDTLGERLLMCRWDRFAVTAYKPVPRGISFSAEEETILIGKENARPTGIAVAPDGRLFVTCLYMAGNMAAPYCASDLVVVSRRGAAHMSAPSIALPSVPTPTTIVARPPDEPFLSDSYNRQLTMKQLAREATFDQLQEHLSSRHDTQRLLATLAIGHRLTVPPVDYLPPAELKLFYPAESSFFKRQHRFYGEPDPVELTTFGRVGVYTTAEWWKTVPHTTEQDQLFALLMTALNDPDDRVRLQAAQYLLLLNDPRSEPLIARTRRDVLVSRLRTAPTVEVERTWTVGPFVDEANSPQVRAPEQGPIDLTATFATAQGPRNWQEQMPNAAWPTADATRAVQSIYLCFNVVSGVRQPALMSFDSGADAQLWQVGVKVGTLDGEIAAETNHTERRRWLLDLQPGSNELLLRVTFNAQSTPSRATNALSIKATSAVTIALPDRVDGQLLTERLREAASGGGSTPAIDTEFLTADWDQLAKTGDPTEGRRLFGRLACNKCHAVTADQKGGGAPSLYEARRRFKVPHLVESILLPSRQVAEPFRAQTITTTHGLALTGLAVSESSEQVELMLPNAQRQTVRKADIEERVVTTLSPMPAGLVKTTAELQHLLAYLLSERPTPP